MTRRNSLRRRALFAFARYASPRFLGFAFSMVLIGGTLLCIAIDWYTAAGSLAMHALTILPVWLGGVGGGL